MTASANSNQGPTPRQHGVKGVYYGGDWLDIEDCAGVYPTMGGSGICAHGKTCPIPCPRSQSRNVTEDDPASTLYDVCIVGAGCIGAAIARELSRYQLRILWLEAADDVSQGATKGNSGIVHAGYDDKPGTNRARFCWPGNQMFSQLDKELKFGYQTNGSLVLAFKPTDMDVLKDLMKRGETNGVKRLKIVDQKELREMEPHVSSEAIGALYSPDAGNVIPYEYTIALAENAVDNGVRLKIRREVVSIDFQKEDKIFRLTARHWEPKEYLKAAALSPVKVGIMTFTGILGLISATLGLKIILDKKVSNEDQMHAAMATYAVVVATTILLWRQGLRLMEQKGSLSKKRPMEKLVKQTGKPAGQSRDGTKVQVEDMFVGGSGSSRITKGETVALETIQAKYVINCAGGASDTIAKLIGDDSFKIKPRLGDYLLLNRNQGHLARHTLFPCPDPILGKGVLVQTTLWGNLILGPTARDTYKAEARDMTVSQVQHYILSKCKQLVPTFDPKETFHAFCGARAKNSRGDWIIEASIKNGKFIHVAGIDSPGLAGSPAIALEVVRLLQKAGLATPKNPSFNPNRDPIIIPKSGMRGLTMGPVDKNDSDGTDEAKMASNVICKCEKVTELEVVRAMRRSLPIDSSQGIRKRTRAGMGHCQGDPDNYCCEARVRSIIARENGVPVSHVGGRPWPATSTLTQRWIDEKEKEQLKERMMKE